MALPANYSITIPSGTTKVSGGRYLGDAAIAFLGNSNMCGNGGGVSAALDATVNQIYQWYRTAPDIDVIVPVDTSTTPHFDHSLNSGLNQVGPALTFADAYATNRPERRVVGLPAGDSGSGFNTNQWLSGQEMYVLCQTLVNNFLADNENNVLAAIMIELGANDVNFYNKAQWVALIDNMINEFRTTAFNTTISMPSFANVPIILCGLAPSFYSGTAVRQAIQDAISETPARVTRTGYVDSTGLASVNGDAIHFTGAANRILGGTRAWTAFTEAEANA